MEQKLGLVKAAIGVRHLINYIETKDKSNFLIVKENIFEVKLWALITFFCNNIDEFIDKIPDFILDSIFLMKPLEVIESEELNGERVTELYGRGYQSNFDFPFREQFEIIRGCLSHCHFSYEDGMISIYNKRGFRAKFDIIWLERLVKTVLSSKKLSLQKGMSDVSALCFVCKNDCTAEDFKLFCECGLINLYKVTSLTSSKATIAGALNIPFLSADKITFELIFQSAIVMMRQNRILITDNRENILNQINLYFKEIEELFGNKIRLELLPFEVSNIERIDESFETLSFKDKLQYLLRKGKCEDPYMYNGIMLAYLLDLLKEIESDEYKDISLLGINDAYDFLLKTYANVFFAGFKQGYLVYDPKLIISYGGQVRFVHAKNIYKEYIKVLKKSIAEMDQYKIYKRFKLDAMKELELYTKLLEEAVAGDAYTDFGWKMRNSLIHNQIEMLGDNWRFFTTGKNLRVKHYNKKKEEWELKDFVNTRPIWEMTISKYSLLQLVDCLFLNIGVDTLSKGESRIREKPND